MALCHPPRHSDQRPVPTAMLLLREAASIWALGAASTAFEVHVGSTWQSGQQLSHP